LEAAFLSELGQYTNSTSWTSNAAPSGTVGFAALEKYLPRKVNVASDNIPTGGSGKGIG
jgi:hypothetical protein